MSYSAEDWKRVDLVLEEARLRLSPPLGWREVALKAGLSTEGIRIIRRGLVDDPRPDNLAKIETALGLPLGTITNVLKDPGVLVRTAATEVEPEPAPEQDPYVADLQERYGLDPTGAEAVAAVIRAVRRKGEISPNPGIRGA